MGGSIFLLLFDVPQDWNGNQKKNDVFSAECKKQKELTEDKQFP